MIIQVARLRRLADNCLMLSSAARDENAREDILTWAAEYHARATELEAIVSSLPAPAEHLADTH